MGWTLDLAKPLRQAYTYEVRRFGIPVLILLTLCAITILYEQDFWKKASPSSGIPEEVAVQRPPPDSAMTSDVTVPVEPNFPAAQAAKDVPKPRSLHGELFIDIQIPGVSIRETQLPAELEEEARQDGFSQCGKAYEIAYSSGQLPQKLRLLIHADCGGWLGNTPLVLKRWVGYWDSSEICEHGGGPDSVGNSIYSVGGKVNHPGIFASFVSVRPRDSVVMRNKDPNAIAFAADARYLTVAHAKEIITYRLPEGAVVRRRNGSGWPELYRRSACGQEDELPVKALVAVSSRAWINNIQVGFSSSTTSLLLCVSEKKASCDLLGPDGQSIKHFPEHDENVALQPLGVRTDGTFAVLVGEWIKPEELGGMRIPANFNEIWIWKASQDLERRKVTSEQDSTDWWREFQAGRL